MDTFVQGESLSSFTYEFFQMLTFSYRTGLDARRVMEDKARATGEDKFITNVVNTSLNEIC
jgi:hypothetical protein